MRHFWLTTLILLFTALSFVGNAQVNLTPSADTDTNSEQQPKGVIDDPDEPDSVSRTRIFSFHHRPFQVWITHLSNPLLDPTGAQYLSNPLDALNGDFFISKGLVGQIHQSLFPCWGDSLDWSYQPDVNIGYNKKPNTIQFHHVQRPYTSLTYASSLKSEYVVKASHTQNIMPRWNIGLDYTLYNPDPIYANSAVKNHYLDINSNYYSRDSRYQVYGGVIWQKFLIGESGGLANDDYFVQSHGSNLSGIPMRNYEAQSLYNTLDLFCHQTYNLVRQVERIKERYTIQVSENDSSQLDTLYWDDTLRVAQPSTFNPGVFGLDLNLKRSARRYIDSTTTYRYSGLLFWTNDAYTDYHWTNPIKLTCGIKPEVIRTNEHDSLQYTLFQTTYNALLTISMPHSDFRFQGDIILSGDYPNGDHRFEAQYNLRFDSLRTLSFSASTQGQSPDFFFYHYHSNTHHWDRTDWDKQRFQRFQASYRRNNICQIDLTARHISHQVFLRGDSIFLHAEQSNDEAWLLQARLMLKFKLWSWFHYDMQQLVQYTDNNDIVHVPLFASKNSIYCDVNIFHHVLRMQAGVDLRYHTAYYADSYNPEVGAFVRQSAIKIGNYIWTDLFLNLQIKRATIFVKAGHLNSMWEQYPNYFLMPHYPGNKFGLYYGVTWQFFD